MGTDLQTGVQLSTNQQSKRENLSNFLIRVKGIFDRSCALSGWITAEISNLSENSGHIYLTLTETITDTTTKRETVAQARATIWRSRSASIQDKLFKATGIRLKTGLKISVQVKASYHVIHSFALDIQDIDPLYTIGDLQAQLKLIKETLVKEGILNKNKKLILPFDYTSIAVIAPREAAGLGDFRREADILAKYDVCNFDYFNAIFQGEKAADSLNDTFQSILKMSSKYQVIVIIRGGGATQDLGWLNNLELARNICNSPLPVFTGIGHEKDNTILDEVAHTRFDTPSKVSHFILKCIEIRVKAVKDYMATISKYAISAEKISRNSILYLHKDLTNSSKLSLSRSNKNIISSVRNLNYATHIIRLSYEKLTNEYMSLTPSSEQIISKINEEITSNYAQILDSSRSKHSIVFHHIFSNMQSIRYTASQGINNFMIDANNLLTQISTTIPTMMFSSSKEVMKLYDDIKQRASSQTTYAGKTIDSYYREIIGQGLDPTLKRGFALARNTMNGKVIHSAHEASSHNSMNITFYDGTIPVKINLPTGEI